MEKVKGQGHQLQLSTSWNLRHRKTVALGYLPWRHIHKVAAPCSATRASFAVFGSITCLIITTPTVCGTWGAVCCLTVTVNVVVLQYVRTQNKILVYIHCESKKLDHFSFEHNFGKCCPILISFSLLQTWINYNQVYPKIYHQTSNLLAHHFVKWTRMYWPTLPAWFHN